MFFEKPEDLRLISVYMYEMRYMSFTVLHSVLIFNLLKNLMGIKLLLPNSLMFLCFHSNLSFAISRAFSNLLPLPDVRT